MSDQAASVKGDLDALRDCPRWKGRSVSNNLLLMAATDEGIAALHAYRGETWPPPWQPFHEAVIRKLDAAGIDDNHPPLDRVDLLVAQRDALRAKVAELEARAEKAERELAGAKSILKTQGESAQRLRSQLAAVERERDEANEELGGVWADLTQAQRERDEAKADLRRYSMSAGMADHYKGLAFAACEALGVSADDAPCAVTDAIKRLAAARSAPLPLPPGHDWDALRRSQAMKLESDYPWERVNARAVFALLDRFTASPSPPPAASPEALSEPDRPGWWWRKSIGERVRWFGLGVVKKGSVLCSDRPGYEPIHDYVSRGDRWYFAGPLTETPPVWGAASPSEAAAEDGQGAEEMDDREFLALCALIANPAIVRRVGGEGLLELESHRDRHELRRWALTIARSAGKAGGE